MAGKMTSFGSELRQEGYSKEDEYFYEVNRDMIQRRRELLDQERKRQYNERQKALHWMRCPKCGQEMRDQALMGIRFERCAGCEGVYFDQGELETLLKAQEQNQFWTKLRDKLSRSDTDWRP